MNKQDIACLEQAMLILYGHGYDSAADDLEQIVRDERQAKALTQMTIDRVNSGELAINNRIRK
jgi:hypothetical protein